MIAYLMTFFAGALCGSLAMGIYAAVVRFRDARDDW